MYVRESNVFEHIFENVIFMDYHILRSYKLKNPMFLEIDLWSITTNQITTENPNL